MPRPLSHFRHPFDVASHPTLEPEVKRPYSHPGHPMRHPLKDGRRSGTHPGSRSRFPSMTC